MKEIKKKQNKEFEEPGIRLIIRGIDGQLYKRFYPFSNRCIDKFIYNNSQCLNAKKGIDRYWHKFKETLKPYEEN